MLIHSYQGESSKPFSLVTSLATGHRANIFSVKFMPQSNDRTVVSCAGDGEVRVFDLEHTGKSVGASNASSGAAARQTRGLGSRLASVYQGVKYLNDGNTNARVFKSHNDRGKRIVTESSPYLFLTCSEDGEVRQFDTRLPSSAYPRPNGGVGFRYSGPDHDNSNTPPPLISYKRFRLDLNTISCSASQPHYIVLGGAHLHCFLHDRRMTGRDVLEERGSPGFSSDTSSDFADYLMGEATLCVRRFAPNGKKTMGRGDNGHVTACKISDANPNEMIGSWSGDHIYSFDLVKSKDALDDMSLQDNILASEKRKSKESSDRKRKRKQENSTTSMEGLRRGHSHPRRGIQEGNPDDVILRVRYENGQSEDISVEQSVSGRLIEQSRESVLNASQKRSRRIAKSVVKIRKLLFSLEASERDPPDSNTNGLSAHTPSFASALDDANAILPEMDEIIRNWQYPVNPSSEELAFHSTLRKNRDSARRFVQASGTLARVLSNDLQEKDNTSSPILEYFDKIRFSETEGPIRGAEETFRYMFLKAILLWLDGGLQALLEGFRKSNDPATRKFERLHPAAVDSDLSAIDSEIIPLLRHLSHRVEASMVGISRPIANVDASRFETDENRYLFSSETAAVNAFGQAIKIPFQDMSSPISYASGLGESSNTAGNVQAQNRQTALKYWGFKIGRGLLMNAGDGVNFAFVDRAYGGLGVPVQTDDGRSQEDINGEEQTIVVPSTTVATRSEFQSEDKTDTAFGAPIEGAQSVEIASTGGEEEYDDEEDDSGEENEMGSSDEEDEDDDFDDEDEDDESDEDSDNDEDEDGDDDNLTGQYLFRGPSERIRLRASVQQDTPVSSHTRSYRGHCNVKTVKDVNFFGLEDEYVVSGCDSGHVFIWDRKTTRLLNILKGDGEVVNVIQGMQFEV